METKFTLDNEPMSKGLWLEYGRKLGYLDQLLKEELLEKIENQLVPDEITAEKNPRWVYNKAKKDIINIIKK